MHWLAFVAASHEAVIAQAGSHKCWWPPLPHAAGLRRLPSDCAPQRLTVRCLAKEKNIRIAQDIRLEMFRFTQLVVMAAGWSLAAAHTILIYPPWRGDNIHTNGTKADNDPSIIPGSIGINYIKDNDTYGFPYGMQWMYPCTTCPLKYPFA